MRVANFVMVWVRIDMSGLGIGGFEGREWLEDTVKEK